MHLQRRQKVSPSTDPRSSPRNLVDTRKYERLCPEWPNRDHAKTITVSSTAETCRAASPRKSGATGGGGLKNIDDEELTTVRCSIFGAEHRTPEKSACYLHYPIPRQFCATREPFATFRRTLDQWSCESQFGPRLEVWQSWELNFLPLAAAAGAAKALGISPRLLWALTKDGVCRACVRRPQAADSALPSGGPASLAEPAGEFDERGVQ